MKKILSLLLAAMMALALLPALAEAPALDPALLDPDGNLPETLENPNLTIVFWMSWNGYRNMKANNPAAFEASMEAKEFFEKKYGGTVEIIGVNWDQQLQKCIDMQQAGDAPDLVLMYESVFHNAVLQGIITNLDDVVSDKDYSYWNISKENYMWKGSHYAVPIKPYLKHITFNRTMFEYEGLEAPDELYAKGEWDFDAFLEAGQALTYDSDGDGEIDQWGFSGYGDSMSHFLVTNHGGILNIDQAEGKVTSALKEPQTMEAIEYMSRMMSNTDGMWMLEDSEMFGYFDNNALGMIVGKEIQDARSLPFDVGMVPYPHGPSGSADEVYVYSQSWAVPTGSKNPEAAAAYIMMVNEVQKAYGDQMERVRYGEGPDGRDMYDIIYDGHTLITRYDKGLADVWTVMSTINNYMAEGVPASTIVERVDPLINAEIEKAFSK